MGGRGGKFGGGSSLCTGIPGWCIEHDRDGLVGCVTSAVIDGALWALNCWVRANQAGRHHGTCDAHGGILHPWRCVIHPWKWWALMSNKRPGCSTGCGVMLHGCLLQESLELAHVVGARGMHKAF